MISFFDMISSFSIPALVSISTWPIVFLLGSKFNIIDYPNQRKIHMYPTLRNGGMLILSGFIFGVAIFSTYLVPHYLIPLFSILVFALGLAEDKHPLNTKTRLILQGTISCICIFTTNAILTDIGIITLPGFLQIPFTIFAIVGVINAYNFIDGLNGLSSGLGIIVLSFLGMLAYQHNDHELFRLAAIFSGGLAGFMVFNSKGKIFMGDSGSYLTGFIIAMLSIMLVKRNPAISPFAPLLITFIPIFDTVFAIYRRKRFKRDPLKADKRHLHHILRRRYNNATKAVVVILLIQTAIALMAVLLYQYTILLVSFTVLTVIFLRRLWLKRIEMGVVSL